MLCRAVLPCHPLQDVEFTVQGGRLFMLQCRSGKRTGAAALRIALDMHDQGLVRGAGERGGE